MQKALKEIYESLTSAMKSDPPPQVRMYLLNLARKALGHWMAKDYREDKVLKFATKISNGFEYWLKFITNPGVKPTIIGRRWFPPS
jgi:hypothetical protein